MKRIFILSFIIIFININIVYGNNLAKIYYFDNTYEENLRNINYEFNLNLTEEEKLEFLIKNLFEKGKDELNYIPLNAKVLNLYFENGDVYINFNKYIKNYGGSNYEINLIKQVLYNCFQFKFVKTVSFLIENKPFDMVEGSFVFKYNIQDLNLIGSII